MVILSTPRLVLRRPRLSDAEAMFAVFSDAAAMQYWDSLPHTSVAQTRRWLEAVLSAPPPGWDDFIVERDGAAIGKCGCWKGGEVGFILHPDHWRQGIGTEALGAVLPYLFAQPGVARLEADVDPRNAACIGLLTKFGFQETGRAERTFLVGDVWCDSVYFALDRP